jgi:hypothetical protein
LLLTGARIGVLFFLTGGFGLICSLFCLTGALKICPLLPCWNFPKATTFISKLVARAKQAIKTFFPFTISLTPSFRC